MSPQLLEKVKIPKQKRKTGRPKLTPRLQAKDPKNNFLDIKNRIVTVAKKHFAAHGFHGASLKDIAKDAQVANSLVNYHFTDKLGLFNHCVDTFSKPWVAGLQRILSEPKNSDDFRVRIDLFVREMALVIVNDPDTFTIIEREVHSGLPHVVRLFDTTIVPSFDTAVSFFKAAQKNGIVKKEFEPEVLAKLLFDLASKSAHKDENCHRLLKKLAHPKQFQESAIHHIVEIIFKGTVTHETRK